MGGENRAARYIDPTHTAIAAEIARADLRRRERERRALGIIQRQIEVPTVSLSEHWHLWGRKLGSALAAELTRD